MHIHNADSPAVILDLLPPDPALSLGHELGDLLRSLSQSVGSNAHLPIARDRERNAVVVAAASVTAAVVVMVVSRARCHAALAAVAVVIAAAAVARAVDGCIVRA